MGETCHTIQLKQNVERIRNVAAVEMKSEANIHVSSYFNK